MKICPPTYRRFLCLLCFSLLGLLGRFPLVGETRPINGPLLTSSYVVVFCHISPPYHDHSHGVYPAALLMQLISPLVSYPSLYIQQPCASQHEFKLILHKHAFHAVSIDVVRLLHSSSTKGCFIIVVIGHCSKWIKAKATCNVTALTTANFIMIKIICQHGSP